MNIKLRLARAKLKLTQNQVAAKANTCLRNYRKIEIENTDPRTSIALKIAEALNTTVEELWGATANKNK